MRNDRERHTRPGEEIQLYTGMRTKACKLIGRAMCVGVTPVTLDFDRDEVIVGARELTYDERQAFARSDGFRDWEDMRDFWAAEHDIEEHGTWHGVLIEWQGFKRAEEIPRHERGRSSQRRRRRHEDHVR